MSTITCPSCNKSYAFKPELAGRKVKCKCGQVISVPQNPEEDALFEMAPDESAPVRQTSGAASGPTCSSCGATLAAGSVICVQCGYNLKTRQHMQTAGAAPAPALHQKSARSGGGFAPGLKPKQVEENRGDITKWLVILGVVAVLIGGSIVGLRFLGHDPESDKPVLDDDDKTVRVAMKDDFPKEAHDWLKTDSSWMMGGWSANQANARIDEWYRMGAKKVYCFGTRMALWVAIELPDEKEKRTALFDWQAKWHAEMFERIRKDKGQKYLVVKLRL
jgi:hypothetical protein